MPLPASKPVDPQAQHRATVATHHFDMAHGDVAALHARIEQSFCEKPLALMPLTATTERLDLAVRTISRAAGPVALIASLAGIGLVLF